MAEARDVILEEATRRSSLVQPNTLGRIAGLVGNARLSSPPHIPFLLVVCVEDDFASASDREWPGPLDE